MTYNYVRKWAISKILAMLLLSMLVFSSFGAHTSTVTSNVSVGLWFDGLWRYRYDVYNNGPDDIDEVHITKTLGAGVQPGKFWNPPPFGWTFFDTGSYFGFYTTANPIRTGRTGIFHVYSQQNPVSGTITTYDTLGGSDTHGVDVPDPEAGSGVITASVSGNRYYYRLQASSGYVKQMVLMLSPSTIITNVASSDPEWSWVRILDDPDFNGFLVFGTYTKPLYPPDPPVEISFSSETYSGTTIGALTDFFGEELPGPPVGAVGGVVEPTNKLELLAPWIGLTSMIIVATVATTIHIKRVKRRKEKQ